MRLYHLSTDPNLTTMIPRIPPYNRTKIGFENGVTKRVCFAPTIKGALSAVPSGKPGVAHYIYVAVSPDKSLIYKPTPNDVPEVSMTHEVWYLAPINVKKVGVLLIGDKYDPQRFTRPILNGKRIFTSTLYRKNYKRFTEMPDKYETKKYLKTQPGMVLEKQAETINALKTIAMVAGAGVGVFVLSHGKITRIGDSLIAKIKHFLKRVISGR